MFERRSKIGLLADSMDCMTGEWKSRRATIGPPSDSYYEYLWDGWDLLGDRDCLRMYRACTAAILKHQPQRRGANLWFANVDFETGMPLDTEQDELGSFYGGLLAQGGDAAIGAALHAQLVEGAGALWRPSGRGGFHRHGELRASGMR